MIYFICGPARVGKSTLFRSLAPLVGGQAVSADLLKASIEHCTDPWPGHPLRNRPEVGECGAEEWVVSLRARDRAIFDGLVPFLVAADDYGDDVLVEGGLWPDHIAMLPIEHRAVVLVDTGPGHGDHLIRAARRSDSAHNWQAGWSDTKLRQWAGHNRYRSTVFARLAGRCGYRVVDVASGLVDLTPDDVRDTVTRCFGLHTEVAA